ncbi:MAG TPA: hypothetical protein VFV94_06225 [Polyangiaceae bacterium]|nr:hypothetical protein [Polyangiaceae bacterium]
MAMSHDPLHRAGGVLPPPPSTPDDGPTALELPPLQPPPVELVKAATQAGRLSLGARLVIAAVFLAGTALTYFLQR